MVKQESQYRGGRPMQGVTLAAFADSVCVICRVSDADRSLVSLQRMKLITSSGTAKLLDRTCSLPSIFPELQATPVWES